MESPRKKYMTDNEFRALVQMMVAYIHQCYFTPSEMRQASILASIIYEEQTIRDFLVPAEVEAALVRVHDWANKKRQ